MKIVIIGNGISGITAARTIRKISDHEITVISKETDYFFSRTALMYIYMGHMRFEDTKPYEDWFWSKNRINLLRARVQKIDFASKTLHLDSGFTPDETEHGSTEPTISYDKLILAVGSALNKFGWPGQDFEGVGGLYSFDDLQYIEHHSEHLKRAVIVGGGLIGIELAEMFHSRNIPVTMLVREESYWDMVLPPEESEMVGHQINKNHIDLRLSTELKEIIGDEHGKATAVTTNHGDRIDCQFVGLTAGVHPNVKWLGGNSLEIDRGILVNEYLETNIEDVYAIGDCAQLKSPIAGRRSIEAVWYTGRMMGETVAHTACGHQIAYDPGVWFNSAKFMDMEYQVYGDVQANPPEHHVSLFWQNDRMDQSIRLTYDRETSSILGFNLMGVRFRQEVCMQWLIEQASIEKVLQELPLANFDPEFFKQHHQGLIDRYNSLTGRSLNTKHKRRYNQVFSFLKKQKS